MSKLDHSGNLYIGQTEVLKGPNYFKPDFSKICNNKAISYFD
jgi:hypothetical protein